MRATRMATQEPHDSDRVAGAPLDRRTNQRDNPSLGRCGHRLERVLSPVEHFEVVPFRILFLQPDFNETAALRRIGFVE